MSRQSRAKVASLANPRDLSPFARSASPPPPSPSAGIRGVFGRSALGSTELNSRENANLARFEPDEIRIARRRRIVSSINNSEARCYYVRYKSESVIPVRARRHKFCRGNSTSSEGRANASAALRADRGVLAPRQEDKYSYFRTAATNPVFPKK
jgi:hypothetical protein